MSITKQTTSAAGRAIRRFMVGTDGLAGTALIEFAVIAPLLFLFMIYIMDFGLFIWTEMEVQNAVQAGAQFAIANGYSSSAITSAVQNVTTFTTIRASPAPTQFYGCPSNSGVTSVAQGSICGDGAGAGQYVTVSASATYNTLIISNIFTSSTYPLTATATVRTQ
jgi:Flp pilus assembly protein TadG